MQAKYLLPILVVFASIAGSFGVYECSYELDRGNSSYSYDLTALSGVSITTADGDYSFQVCGGSGFTCGSTDNAAVCDLTSTATAIGQADKTAPLAFDQTGLTITYAAAPSTGSCAVYGGYYTLSNVQLVCNATASTPVATFVSYDSSVCLYTFQIQTASACPTVAATTVSSCSFSDSNSGVTVDLTSASGDYFYLDAANAFTYELGLCKSASCGGDSNVGACQSELRPDGFATHDLGEITDAIFTEESGIGQLEYDNGDSCNGGAGRVTYLQLVCNSTATTSIVSYLGENPTCHYTFSISSASACAITSLTTSTAANAVTTSTAADSTSTAAANSVTTSTAADSTSTAANSASTAADSTSTAANSASTSAHSSTTAAANSVTTSTAADSTSTAANSASTSVHSSTTAAAAHTTTTSTTSTGTTSTGDSASAAACLVIMPGIVALSTVILVLFV